MAGHRRRYARTRRIGRECGPNVELQIAGQVLARGDVVGRAGIENHERTQAKPPRESDCATQKQPIPYREGRSPVVHAQIVLIRWKTRCAGSIAVGVVQRIETEQGELRSRPDVEIGDQLVLPEKSIGGILIDVALVWIWAWPTSGVRCARCRRIGIDRQKLVHAARIQIRNRNVGDLCELSLQAERGLHDVGRVQSRSDLINRRGRLRRQSVHRRHVREKIYSTRHGILLLGDPVQTVRIQHVVLTEAIVEQPEATAQHGFRCALASPADAPRKTDARGPIRMIVNRVLGFKAQTGAERESGTHLPIILHVQTGIHHGSRHGGNGIAGGQRRIELKLSRACRRRAVGESLQSGLVSQKVREGEAAVEISARRVDFANCPQPSSEFHKVLALQNRSEILKFVMILVVRFIS